MYVSVMSSLRVFLTVFPSAVPNDPLVPTAVLGETSSMVGCIASVTSKCPVVTTRHRHEAPVLVALSFMSLCVITWSKRPLL